MSTPLSESEIIHLIAKSFPHATEQYVGIGDDAALLFHHKDSPLIITTDTLIEDVHFRLNYFTPETLSNKVLQVNLSDIAAMGGQPQYLLLNLSIPPSLSSDWIKEFIHHITQLCHRYAIPIIGGDTTRSPDKLYINAVLIGNIGRSVKRRNSAKVNDFICVTGPLGDAHAGLTALENNQEGFLELKNRYLEVKAKLIEGSWLGSLEAVTAMMDISDGLYLDLKKLCKASQVGAAIFTESIPQSPALKKAAAQLKLDPLMTAIQGGEDYELLFTVKQESLNTLLKAYEVEFKKPLSVIGQIKTPQEIIYFQNQQPLQLTLTPYTHFGENP